MIDTQVKVALVTGASGGIGRAVALRLARDGFWVVLNYAGNAETAETAVAEIKAADGHAFAVKADVADAAAVEGLFQETLGAFGRIDLVVNCAGIMPIGPIAEGSLEAFDRVIATNLRGSFIVMGQAAKHATKGGRIIMFSSSVIAKSFPGYGPYIASKAGVEGLVQVLANELRGREITVNAVAPGPVATELFLKGKTEAQIEQLRRLPPLERLAGLRRRCDPKDSYRARSPRRGDPQRGPYGVRAGGSLYSGTVRPALRHQCAQHPAREPRSPASLAQAEERSRDLGVEQQLGGWNSTLSGTVFRGEGRDGCLGGGLRA